MPVNEPKVKELNEKDRPKNRRLDLGDNEFDEFLSFLACGRDHVFPLHEKKKGVQSNRSKRWYP